MIDPQQCKIVVKLKHLYPDDPVDRLRGVNVVAALKKRGWDIELYNNQQEIDLIIYLDDYNLYERLIYEHIKAKITVVDIQDNHLNRHNPASQFIKNRRHHSKFKRLLVELKQGILPLFYKVLTKKIWYKLYIHSLKQANHLVCSSHALTKVYLPLNPRTVTIVDALDTVSLPPSEKSKRISICWVGTQNNIVYLQLVDKAIALLQKEYDLDFYIITADTIFDDPASVAILNSFEMQYQFTKWNKETVAAELQKHHIAIAPLPSMTEKSTNKILTYMGAGLATVASGAQDYQQLHTQYPKSFHFLEENTTTVWYQALERLIIDTTQREAYVQKAQEVITAYSIDKIILQYEALFQELLSEPLQ